MELTAVNPYIRAAMLQPAIIEGKDLRKPFDHRLFLVLEGEGRLVTEQGEFLISPYSLMIFPPAFGYLFQGKMRVLVLNFDLTRAAQDRTKPMCPLSVEMFDPASVFDMETLEGLPIPFFTKVDEIIAEELYELVNSFDKNNKVADAFCSAVLKKTLAELLRRMGHSSQKVRIVERVQQYIRLNAPQIRSSEEIARHFGYHPIYLASIFRRETGQSLHGAILDARVLAAKQWLVEGDCSIDEIAYSSGFSSSSHFCTVFRQRTGLSPKSYRKSMLDNTEKMPLYLENTEEDMPLKSKINELST